MLSLLNCVGREDLKQVLNCFILEQFLDGYLVRVIAKDQVHVAQEVLVKRKSVEDLVVLGWLNLPSRCLLLAWGSLYLENSIIIDLKFCADEFDEDRGMSFE